MSEICSLCPRKCKVDRSKGKGYCGMSNQLKVALVSCHMWEEPPISGTKGSGTIFFSGCNLKCCFCQNWDVSKGIVGYEITVERLAEIFKELEEKGVHNINLVTPSHYVVQIKQALDIYRPSLPIVYNTSGYDSVEELKMLEGYVDIYLTDYKYFDAELANKYSKCPDYPSVVLDAIKEMLRQQPKTIMENGLLKKGVLIRHMILPNHSEDSVAVLHSIKEHFGSDVMVSLMSQYTPCYQANLYEEINRPIKKLEYTRVLSAFQRENFKHGFMQELSSSTTEFIPHFDGSGVQKK